jgi:ribosomal protein S18 acetylase RimI-like enzyme
MALQRADFTVRPACDSDRTFLYGLHRQTMRGLIEQTWGWDERWQQLDFERRFRDYRISIIERDGRAAGGLFLEWRTDAIYIHEIQLTPESQGLGIGSAVVMQVIGQAWKHGLPTTLSVLEANRRARQLYERLGFRVTALDAPFIRMQRDPDR